MAVARPLWEIAHMAKKDVEPGISARVEGLLMRAKPEGLSVNQFCKQSKVSTSFFTDIRNGREPGIDKVERLANRAGLKLSELVDGADAFQPGRLAIPIALPSGERLRAAMNALIQQVDLQGTTDALVDELVLLLPNALEQAGAVLAPSESDQARKRAGRPRPPAIKDRG